MKKVVIIGGGTGTYVVLSGLKKYDLKLSAIVTMMDSGGSTGRLRDQLGVLPPGDIRQCLVALSEAPDLWRKLFLYRFESGDLKGHNFGNIFLSALEMSTNAYQDVIDTASYILKTKGDVIPVTFEKVTLCAKYLDGETICGEKFIDTAFHKTSPIESLFVKPTANANQMATTAISQADFIIIGPGDLYTSLIPNLVIEGIASAIKQSKAIIIVPINLMTKQGQTTNYSVKNHVADIEKYIGKKVDVILINNGKIDQSIIDYYASHQEKPVQDDLTTDKRVIVDDIIMRTVYTKFKSDVVDRSMLRHDTDKLGAALFKILNK